MPSMITVRIGYGNEKVCFKSIFLAADKPSAKCLQEHISTLKKEWRASNVAIVYIKEDIRA